MFRQADPWSVVRRNEMILRYKYFLWVLRTPIDKWQIEKWGRRRYQ
jgi:hypothetical protein